MDVLEAIEKRRSIRKYNPDPIPTEKLRQILEAARLAPSGGNRQPWRFIVVRDPERKKALAQAERNQMFIADADTVVITLGDSAITLIKPLAISRVPHVQDPMIAVEHMVLAATALGYGTCWIGASHEAKVKEILKVPKRFVVIALLAIGIPNESPPPRPRKAFEELFIEEVFDRPLIL